ncbi:flagellar hook-associated protein FlgK [Fluviibacterium sp. DFM31]|uniref:Flagellar hook-associated protein 1 n=1 Tax=Meridianimarinicoccus marinus TaxID=3231483 RepID=A0ABV3L6X8_9RHOB
MSISGALANALSGLNAASRSASVVSDNLANALTEGFGRREVELGTRASGAGGGVQIVSVDRVRTLTLLTDQRAASADLAGADTRSAFLARVQDLQGEPGSGTALTDLVSGVETALVAALARPDQLARQTQVVDALSQLVTRIAQTSDSIQVERARADAGIGQAVAQLETDLTQIAQLNTDIRKATMRGDAANALKDTRQRLVDRVSELVPVREVDRGLGMIALMSEGGLLLDGTAPTFDFQTTPVITAHHTAGAGLLSGIQVNGQPVDLTRDKHLLSGGRLAAMVSVRDDLSVTAQAQLDGFARDLLDRVSASGVDPTVAAGAPGLLTDGGGAFLAANETGLSQRLALNAAVNPAQGGQVWRLRDGLGAAAPGAVGDGAGLARLRDAMANAHPPASSALSGASRTAAGQAADLYTALGTERLSQDTALAHATARHAGLSEALQAEGVDSDREMQKLLLIEQAYAANARVISAAQGMLDTLLEI